MNIRVGYAQKIITPALERPCYLAGFGRNRRAESVHDDLYARALALDLSSEDGEISQLIVIALDLIGLSQTHCLAIEKRVQKQLPQAQLLIACTHTHYGPDTLGLWGPDEQTSGVDVAYMVELEKTVAAAALAAVEEQREARLASTSVMVPGVAKNNRDPHILDEELTCLQFRGRDERPLATWLIFPCHPEVLGSENPHITADYMFTLRQRVEEQTGAPCLSLIGALGGMMTPDVVEHSFAAAAAMGETLAQAALSALAQAEAVPLETMTYLRQSFSVPLENPLLKMAVASGLLPNIERDDGTILTEASLLQLDDRLLFAVPGELLPKLGLRYRDQMKAAGAELTAIVGLANDELGYILPQEDFIAPENYLEPGSSYEESMSICAGIGPSLTATLQALLAASGRG